MWTMVILFGLFLLMRGLYFLVKGIFIVLKCIFIYLFASEEFIDKEFDKLVEEEFNDYRSFEKELDEIIKR